MEKVNEKDLRNGKEFYFDNEKHQTEIESDDIRTASVLFNKDYGFHIWFNGSLISSTKTFKPMENRLNKLIKKWNLTQVESDNI